MLSCNNNIQSLIFFDICKRKPITTTKITNIAKLSVFLSFALEAGAYDIF
jgi:hypothetical protein